MIRSLTRTERGWAFAALGAIYPSHAHEALSVGVCDLALGEYLADLFATIPLMAVLGLRTAIWMVALAPPFVLGRLSTVVGLDAVERQTLVERLMASSSYGVRQLVVALKAIGGLFFGGAASVRAGILASGGDPSPELVSVARLTAKTRGVAALPRGESHART
jgi:hypothetical protein